MTKHVNQPVEGAEPSEPKKTYISPGVKAGIATFAVVIFIVGLGSGVLIGRATTGQSNGRPMQSGGDSQQFPGGGMQGGPSGQSSQRGMGMFGGGITGEVTEVSSSSIMLKEERTGGLITYQVTDDTEVTDDGDDAKISDVQVGDTVAVQGTDDEDDSAAGTITLNPSTPTRGQFQ